MSRARELRRNSTSAEQKLWALLRNRNLRAFKFRRQQPLCGYVADFVCLEKRLILEVDGGQHADQVEKDQIRTQNLEAQGFRILRFWNNDVLGNPEGVTVTIEQALHDAPTAPNRFPRTSSKAPSP